MQGMFIRHGLHVEVVRSDYQLYCTTFSAVTPKRLELLIKVTRVQREAIR